MILLVIDIVALYDTLELNILLLVLKDLIAIYCMMSFMDD